MCNCALSDLPNLPLKLRLMFLPCQKMIRTFPATVQVNFKVAQKDFSNIQPNQFKVVPEIEQTDINNAKRLHLILVEKPDFIRDEWITPTDVEFLIIK